MGEKTFCGGGESESKTMMGTSGHNWAPAHQDHDGRRIEAGRREGLTACSWDKGGDGSEKREEERSSSGWKVVQKVSRVVSAEKLRADEETILQRDRGDSVGGGEAKVGERHIQEIVLLPLK